MYYNAVLRFYKVKGKDFFKNTAVGMAGERGGGSRRLAGFALFSRPAGERQGGKIAQSPELRLSRNPGQIRRRAVRLAGVVH